MSITPIHEFRRDTMLCCQFCRRVREFPYVSFPCAGLLVELQYVWYTYPGVLVELQYFCCTNQKFWQNSVRCSTHKYKWGQNSGRTPSYMYTTLTKDEGLEIHMYLCVESSDFSIFREIVGRLTINLCGNISPCIVCDSSSAVQIREHQDLISKLSVHDN